MESDSEFPYLHPEILKGLLENGTDRDLHQRYVEIAKLLATDISHHKLTFLQLFEKLNCLLLSITPENRRMGVLILGETICVTANDFLSPQELTVIAQYFCEKLKDHHEVAASSFKGVLALINTNTPDESIVLLLSTLFNHIPCQQQVRADRLIVYHILEATVKNRKTVVNTMAIDFVYGVISLIDGERDPTNLDFLFCWIPSFLKVATLGHLTEEMFEVLSCYFPVDFKPSQHDQHKISRESLADALCNSLTCLSDFGPMGVPLALEKLDSTLNTAIEDSLDLLKRGCQNYEVSIYNKHSIELWSMLQNKIFHSSDEIIKSKCLETLRVIINKLSQGDINAFENTVLDIIDMLKFNLLPDSKVHQQSADFLINVARSSKVSSVLVAKKVCPLLENLFKISNNDKQKAATLHCFVDFVTAVIDQDPQTNLHEFEEIANCPILCSQAIESRDNDLVIEGFSGFNALAQSLPDSIRNPFLHVLQRILVLALDKSVKLEVFKVFRKMALLYPEQVKLKVLYTSEIDDCAAVDRYLESLGSLVGLPYFEDYLANIFLNYIRKDLDISTVALKHLNNFWCKSLANSMLKDLLIKFMEYLQQIDNNQALTEIFLKNVKITLENIIRASTLSLEQWPYQIRFLNPNISVIVLCSVIIPLPQDQVEIHANIDVIIEKINNENMQITRDALAETVGTVLNKMPDEQKLTSDVILIKNKLALLDKYTQTSLISWSAKGLLTRNHWTAWEFVDMLINNLHGEITDAAKGFTIIMNDNDRVLSKENNCKIVPFYKHKVVNYCANKFNEILDINEAHLSAVGYLIEKMPKSVIITSFKKIFRLILLCLGDSKNPQILLIILERITELLASGELIIQDSLEDILTRVLNLTSFEASMVVRIAAIKFLKAVVLTSKVYLLLPHKTDVIKQLGKNVDDKKRLVRREAMECRSMWYLLDAPI
ncbi:MMS19 nucleotide excision repair protein [Euwallacea fornicatus]|uniref:MMS19 nucleotide excision repair protein n=1 Tax=Euwallacea fornicatus TaxID=995702 RepID=UPI00338F8044